MRTLPHGYVRDVQVILAHADPGVRRRFTARALACRPRRRGRRRRRGGVERCRERAARRGARRRRAVPRRRAGAAGRDQGRPGGLSAPRSCCSSAPDLDLDAARRRRCAAACRTSSSSRWPTASCSTRVEAAGRTKVLQEELVAQAARLEALLFEDALTGLSNRRFDPHPARRAWSPAARRHGRPLSIAIFDLDHFKRVNDGHGHTAGDRVLVAAAHALRDAPARGGPARPPRRRGVPRPAARHRRRRRRRTWPRSCAPRSPARAHDGRARVTVEHRLWPPGTAKRPRSCSAAPTRRSTRPRLPGRDRVDGAPATLHAPHMTLTAEDKREIVTQVRQGRDRHRGHRGPDRAAHASHQPPHRAPSRAQARPPLAPRPADARRPPPPLPELPPEEGPRGLPLADPRARPAPVDDGRASQAGQPAPEFSLATYEGDAVHRASTCSGRTTVLVFYPFAFSPVCTDQLRSTRRCSRTSRERGATLYGVSCDATWSQQAFREQLGVEIEQLSDFEPKGAACRAFGVLHPGGFPRARAGHDRPRRHRALEPRGRRRPATCPARTSSSTRSTLTRPEPRLRPAAAGRPRRSRAGPGGRAAVIVYGDYECPFCAALEARLRELALRVPSGTSRCARATRARRPPRAPPRPRRLQGAFWADARRAVRRPGPARGPAPVGPRRAARASTSRASTPTAAPTRSPRGCASTSAAGSGRAWRRRRRCSSGGDAPRRAPRPGAVGCVAPALTRARTAVRLAPYTDAPDGPQRRPAHRSACAPDATGEALRALYRTYAGELYGFALNALGERGAAEEVVQEVFTRAWRHAETYDADARQRAHLALPDRPPRDHRRAPARRRAPGAGAARAARRARRREASRRSSGRCSAGRSPRRSSGSRPSTAR